MDCGRCQAKPALSRLDDTPRDGDVRAPFTTSGKGRKDSGVLGRPSLHHRRHANPSVSYNFARLLKLEA